MTFETLLLNAFILFNLLEGVFWIVIAACFAATIGKGHRETRLCSKIVPRLKNKRTNHPQATRSRHPGHIRMPDNETDGSRSHSNPGTVSPQTDFGLKTAAALLFLAFGVSDFVEIQTGGWYKPWWLFAWKASNLTGLVICYLRYRQRLTH